MKQTLERLAPWRPIATLTAALLFGTFVHADCTAQSQEVKLAFDISARPLRFSHVTMKDGLASPLVYAVVQDEDGFIWLGTGGTGVYRYDGSQFVHHGKKLDDPNSLEQEDVTGLAIGRKGELWVGTWGGLSRLDIGTGVWQNYHHDPEHEESILRGQVTGLDLDASGTLWVTTSSGLNRMDPATGRFVRYVHDPAEPGSLREGRVYSLCVDSRGSVWVGTETGLSRMDSVTGHFTHYEYVPGASHGIGPGRVQAIFEDASGTIWVGAWGLSRYDRENDRFDTYLPDPRYPHFDMIPDSHVNGIRAIEDDKQGGLWLGASYNASSPLEGRGGGLYHFEPEKKKFSFYRHDPTDPYTPASDHVLDVHMDHQGILWVATDAGVSRADAMSGYFRLYQTGSRGSGYVLGNWPKAFRDRSGMLWIAAGTYLNQIDAERGTIRYTRGDATAPGSVPTYVSTILQARDGALWFAGWGGLYRRRPGASRFDRFSLSASDAESMAGLYVFRVLQSLDGTIWAGARDSDRQFWLCRLDTASERCDRFPSDGSEWHDFLEDRNGILWVATSRSLLRIDRLTGAVVRRWSEDTDPESSVYRPSSLAERPGETDMLWIGTYGDGLIRMNTRTDEITRFTAERYGFTSNSMNGIAADSSGRIWIASERGITRFDPDAGKVRNYDETDGVQHLEFLPRLSSVSADGEIFFGGRGGLNAFYPDEIRDNPNPPQVRILRLLAGREPVPLSHSSDAGTGWRIEIPHARNDVSIAFVGLHFAAPEKNRYAHMLDGYDEAWSDTTESREATYTNLPPGAYTFRVKAANSDGVWNEEGAALAITVLPPWWRTWWAYGLYTLLLIAAVAQAYRWQHNRIVRREREAARERELEQAHEIEKAHTALQQSHAHLQATQAQLVHAEKMASLGALTAGIAHEIKNPLNFITGFAEVNVEMADDLRQAWHNGTADVEALLDHLKRNAEVIDQHGKRADAIVQSMMRHASGGTGEREATDVNALVGEYVELAYHGKTPGFPVTIERDLGAEVGRVEMVAPEIGRVMLNLLANAFDAVGEWGKERRGEKGNGAPDESATGRGGQPSALPGWVPTVKVSTRRVGDQVEIRIADNGPGTDKNLLPKIFEPFYTTKPAGSGTGLGLSLAYDIVTQGHGGALTVESEEGQGATFVVTLPVG